MLKLGSWLEVKLFAADLAGRANNRIIVTRLATTWGGVYQVVKAPVYEDEFKPTNTKVVIKVNFVERYELWSGWSLDLSYLEQQSIVIFVKKWLNSNLESTLKRKFRF